jgi:hypothetical protein
MLYLSNSPSPAVIYSVRVKRGSPRRGHPTAKLDAAMITRTDLREFELRLTINIAGMLLVAVSVLAAAILKM